MSLFAAFAVHAKPFSFVALGDLPYGSEAHAYPPYRVLIGTINKMHPPFSIHVGDVKSGSTLCSDQELQAQTGHFNMFEAAVVYTPGDNEWTDCHRANNGAYDPQERLQALRKRFFTPGQSLGKAPLKLQNQSTLDPAHSQFIENQRWLYQQVLFVTLHIVGSNNNFEVRDPSAVAEFFERDKANVAWIRDAFAFAQQTSAKANVFAMQADVFESKSIWEDFPGHSGFRNSIGNTLLPLTAEAAVPVLLIHGDSHVFRFDQPFNMAKKPLNNLTRLIVPGANDVRAVHVTVDTRQPMLFAVRLIETTP
ncbi:MAG: hypothetical protein HQ445_05065 [Polaromonas sp.]|nr:hypothetical protein [Polaromonas sp.]